MDGNSQFMASTGELPRHIDAHTFTDVVKYLLVAGFVSHQQESQPVVAHDLQGLSGDVGFGIAGPGDPELSEFARDGFGARPIIGKRVVVEEEFPHLRKRLSRPANFLNDIGDAAGPVAMAADGLRPKAKRAPRLAPAAGVE